MNEIVSKYVVWKDEIFERHSDGFFVGYTRVNPPLTKMNPYLSYVGPKIPLGVWRPIVVFLKWAYEESKGESQVRLYFHKDHGWRAWAFPQEYNSGMSTKEIPEKCDEENVKAGLTKGWIESGSVHSHCSSSAFQSGTDHDNEQTKNGIHVTVGELNKLEYSLHGRASFRGIFYDVDWAQWFALPAGLEGLPYTFRSQVMKYFLAEGVREEEAFPEEWKANLIKKVWTPATPTPHNPEYPFWSPQNGHRSNTEKDGGKTEKESAKRLSRKERRRLRRQAKLEASATAETKDAVEGFFREDVERLQKATVKVKQLAAFFSMEVLELFTFINATPDFLAPDEKSALDELEEIAHKEAVDLEDLEDWIITCSLLEEEDIPTEGGSKK